MKIQAINEPGILYQTILHFCIANFNLKIKKLLKKSRLNSGQRKEFKSVTQEEWESTHLGRKWMQIMTKSLLKRNEKIYDMNFPSNQTLKAKEIRYFFPSHPRFDSPSPISAVGLKNKCCICLLQTSCILLIHTLQ